MTRHSSVIAQCRNRDGNDPIFIWNGEARARAAAAFKFKFKSSKVSQAGSGNK